MTILNRDRFLDNIAENLGRSRRTEGVERPKWSVSPQWDVLRDATQDELVDVLKKQCKEIHTDFVLTNKEGLSKELREIIAGYEGNSIVVSNDTRNAEYGLDVELGKLEKEGIEVHLWDSELGGDKNLIFAERADIGITFSDVTLAESGTVTLFNNAANGRSISLLPRTYIAIIPKSTIVPRMTQAAKLIHDATVHGEDVPSCISFITGPSNSADIEMNLIVGVHGPIHVTYIVVD